MIPQISYSPGLVQLVLTFLNVLKEQGFCGDSATSYADRLAVSTDNSVYQLLPDAVLFPRSTADVTLIARVAGEKRFTSLLFTPRGGGTGTNGQALNRGIVVDMSRYMNRILEIDPDRGWVRVEAGVIKDQLNAYLKSWGYFFSPELSTSNRATLGGMINTDASGQGSLVYGKTSDHVQGLRAVLLGGELLDTREIPIGLAELLAQEATQQGRIYRTALEVCRGHRQLIMEKFPELNRFLTGYDLRHVISDDMQFFDLSRLLCGSEGTLAFICEARLNITPIPKVRRLINVKYDAFDAALRSAPVMLEAQALSVETVDSMVLDLAREDIVWQSVHELITDVPDQQMMGLNIVEFAGNDHALIERHHAALCRRLEAMMAAGDGGIIGYQCCDDPADIERIYTMRKKAVGLLGNTQGGATPVAFVEDTAVPPEHLAEYIAEFRTLLDSYGLSYGMFGHVDAGVLHVRPALDMCDPLQEKLLKKITDQVVKLTAHYGGLLWGEHGKGFRAAYSPAFFGETLWQQLRHIKAAFDPNNRLNPGKICTPSGTYASMLTVEAATRGSHDRQIALDVRTDWRGAMMCNGNGQCFNVDVNSPMCPSMKITANRIHSPKGRAALTREWLRLMAEKGTDLRQLEKQLASRGIRLRRFIARIRNSWYASKGDYDFSHEVKEAMSGCLACKACTTQCPVKIDVPGFRSRFLQLYYTRYLRPLSDHLIAGVESYAPVLAQAPKATNFLLTQRWLRALIKRQLGLVDLPRLSVPPLKKRLAGHSAVCTSLENLEKSATHQREKTVLIVQDPFTSFYEAQLVSDFVQLTEKLGYKPVLLPFLPNGKVHHVKGFLQGFARIAQNAAHFFNRLAQLNIPLVGLDPAMVLCYRDEYKQILGEKRGGFQVQMVHEWLHTLPEPSGQTDVSGEPWYLFAHCTEVTALPSTPQQWQNIFARFGAQLEYISVGCCGMAGSYGHESKNLAQSLGIYQLSWHQWLQKFPRQRCMATGFSCRSQVKRVEGNGMRHPLQVLLELIHSRNTTTIDA